MPTSRLVASLAAVALLAGCGGREEPAEQDAAPAVAERPHSGRTSACPLVRPAQVRKLAAKAGGEPVARVRPRGRGSDELASCHWNGPGVAVSVTVDRARDAEKRYWYRQAEQQQFYADDPERTPITVTGVGQDRSYGGGAFWMPGTKRLLAVRDGTMLIVGFSVRGASQEEARSGAADLGRAAFRGLFGRRKPGEPADLGRRGPVP